MFRLFTFNKIKISIKFLDREILHTQTYVCVLILLIFSLIN